MYWKWNGVLCEQYVCSLLLLLIILRNTVDREKMILVNYCLFVCFATGYEKTICVSVWENRIQRAGNLVVLDFIDFNTNITAPLWTPIKPRYCNLKVHRWSIIHCILTAHLSQCLCEPNGIVSFIIVIVIIIIIGTITVNYCSRDKNHGVNPIRLQHAEGIICVGLGASGLIGV